MDPVTQPAGPQPPTTEGEGALSLDLPAGQETPGVPPSVEPVGDVQRDAAFRRDAIDDAVHSATGREYRTRTGSMPTPSVGRTVHVTHLTHKTRPGIITNVPDNVNGLVDLTLFCVPELDGGTHVVPMHNVPYDATGKRDPSWRVPEWD